MQLIHDLQAVKLETARTGRTRYLVVVSRPAKCRLQNQPHTSPTTTTNNNNNNNINAQSTRPIASATTSLSSIALQRKKSTLTAKYSTSRTSTASTQKYQDLSKIMTRSVTDTKLQNCDSSNSINSTEAMWLHSGGAGGSSDAVQTDSDDDSSDSNRNRNEVEESCLLGIDCNEKTTVGLVLRILADTTIRLDGDGYAFNDFI